MKYTNKIWYFRLMLDHSTTVLMPSGARITQGNEGVFITYPDQTKRYIKNDWHD